MLSRVAIGGSGLSVSRVCLGTKLFGTAIDQQQAGVLLDTFVRLGGNFIETARCYGDWVFGGPAGASEQTIGQWLQARAREELVIATKGGYLDIRSGSWYPRVYPEAIASDIGESIESLQVDYIDLWWLHMDDPYRSVRQIMDTLIAQQRAGRIRHFGVCNWSAARIEEAQAYARSLGHTGFIAAQIFWGLAEPNLAGATTEETGPYYDDELATLHAQGLTMIPYGSQCRGFFSKLAGYGEGGIPRSLGAVYLNDVNRHRLKVIRRLAREKGSSVNQIVLAYLLSQRNPTIPVIGACRPEQLAESAEAQKLHLSTHELQLLNARSDSPAEPPRSSGRFPESRPRDDEPLADAK